MGCRYFLVGRGGVPKPIFASDRIIFDHFQSIVSQAAGVMHLQEPKIGYLTGGFQ